LDFETWFSAAHPQISTRSALAVIALSKEGATLPFIARYRKEQTGNLDEVAIQLTLDARDRWDALIKRQAFIVGEIEAQKKLTPELKEKILSTFQMDTLEDLYLPYKQKRKTKAELAREAGLGLLADWIWNCGHGTETPHPGQTLDLWAFTFRNEEKGITDAPMAVQGAQDILTERLAEIAELRQLARNETLAKGHLRSVKSEKAKANSKFENYFNYHEPIQSLLQPQSSHRYLALRRGWLEEELTVTIGPPPTEGPTYEDELVKAFESAACTVPDSPGAAVLAKAARQAFKAYVLPAIETEVHRSLKDLADDIAIKVFAENVRKLLLSSPFGPKAVLGVDPGIRTGCKLAVVDDAGKYVGSHVMSLQSDADKQQAKAILKELFDKVKVQAIAVGNGTAGRETEIFVRSTLKESALDIPVVMVSEAGASVYSASETAREEFPDLDVTIRGAISIARRLQDPLAELVKIDPRSIGVGQYQHDVAVHSLRHSLENVVDSCVNSVGVNLNTASYHLLAHVAGIGPSLAKAVVTHRSEKGLFHSRSALLEVPRFSAKAFEQSAGFLRVPESDNPLDNTGVHPERYAALEQLSQRIGKSLKELMGAGVTLVKSDEQLAKEVGSFTFDDIVHELEKPGRDPRNAFIPFNFRDDIFELKDLKSGMQCPGIVTNVTNFGAFVDIGVHQDGLVHISQLAQRFVKDPREVVSPGDRVTVRVLEVNLEKSQISLSMKPAPEVRPPAPRPQPRPRMPAKATPPPRPKKPQRPRFEHHPFAALAALKDGGNKKPGN
jgi:uncharacterized protein